ncbi:MAG: NTP transferase domain-containing protein [Rhodospirillales bacterium]
MKAVMLAAGLGRRLYGDKNDNLPKALLSFEGRTLLDRHITILRDRGVTELVLVVGHRKDDVLAEAEAVAPKGYVRSLFNPRYEEGPMLSLWTATAEFRAGDDVLFMDADVLYPPEMMDRLLGSTHGNCFIIDREFEPGEDPVKLCIRDGVPVDFGKQVTEDYDEIGEWPGFLRMTADVAAKVAAATDAHVAGGDLEAAYEEAIRDVLVAEPPGAFGFEDITGIPWIEIDFPSDLLRAEKIIYPLVTEFEGDDAGTVEPDVRDKASGE